MIDSSGIKNSEKVDAEALIRDYLLNRLMGFTWYIDIAEHSIWGFRGARYKNFVRALSKVEDVVQKMVQEKLVELDYPMGNSSPVIYVL